MIELRTGASLGLNIYMIYGLKISTSIIKCHIKFTIRAGQSWTKIDNITAKSDYLFSVQESKRIYEPRHEKRSDTNRAVKKKKKKKRYLEARNVCILKIKELYYPFNKT